MRGRSSSSALNRVLRTVVPYLLACRIRLVILYVTSEGNPADDGTRNVALRDAKPPSEIVNKLVEEIAQAQVRILKLHKARYRTPCYVFWDLFSGPNAPLSKAFSALGWTVITMDTLRGGADEDLTRPEVIDKLRRLALEQPPTVANLGPPCSNFGPWVHAWKFNTRTVTNPWGDGIHPKEQKANVLLRSALAVAKLLDDCETLWSWEQPVGSLQWRTPELQSLLSSREQFSVIFDWCGWNRPWRKRTAFRGRNPILPAMRRLCTRDHEHIVLQGPAASDVRDASGQIIRWTAVASEYSPEFCKAFAQHSHDWVCSVGR